MKERSSVKRVVAVALFVVAVVLILVAFSSLARANEDTDRMLTVVEQVARVYPREELFSYDGWTYVAVEADVYCFRAPERYGPRKAMEEA